jgi:hypothetical protein
MHRGVLFIAEPPVGEIDGAGVNVVAKSGELFCYSRFRRCVWRCFLETEIRKLNEYEIAERDNVIRLRASG